MKLDNMFCELQLVFANNPDIFASAVIISPLDNKQKRFVKAKYYETLARSGIYNIGIPNLVIPSNLNY